MTGVKVELDDVFVDKLELRPDLQPREALDDETVAEYAQAMEAGDEFPPIEVVMSEDGEHLWVWDGFHRVMAAKRIGRERIATQWVIGDLRDAVLKSVTANTTHGLRRSNADKRKAVTVLLEDPEWSQWSNREIARRTKTSHPFVAQVREELGTGNVSSARKFEDANGNVRTMDTSGIAEANQQRAEAETGVNDDTLGMICRTSVDYAGYYIKRANVATLRAALKYEQQHRNRSSLIEKIERRIRQLDKEAGSDGLSQEDVKAGIYAYLHEHYDEDDVASQLVELNDARQWNNYGSIEKHLDGAPAMRNGIIHAVDEVVRDLRERRDAVDEHEAEQAEEPEYAPIWQLEGHVQLYLNTRLGYRGQGDVTEENLTRRLDILSQEGWIYDALADAIDEPHRKGDLIQAVNNVADTLRQRVQAIRKPDPTVRYESVDVPESVEGVEVVETPPTKARQSEIKVTYLPKPEAPDPAPAPHPEDDAGPATIDVSLVLDPEAEKFHIEVSERDVPEGTYRGKLENLHRTLDVAITRVWPEAKRFLAPVAPEPEDDPSPPPEPQHDHDLNTGDWVRWGSGPEQCGEIINFTPNGRKVFVRDQKNRIHHYPPHMLTVVQRAEAAA